MHRSNQQIPSSNPGSATQSIRRLTAFSLGLLTITAAGNAFALDTYPGQVATWCANAGRPAPEAATVVCDNCHANETPFLNLRRFPTNTDYLNYYCSVVANPSNKAPVVKVISSANAVEGNLLNITVGATDPDGNPVTLSAMNLPQGASFDSTSGLFSWKPDTGTAASSPTVVVTFEATDVPSNGAVPLTSQASVTIHVAATASTVNNPPVITPIPDQNVSVGQTLTFRVEASDKDGDIITLSASGQPIGASFNPKTGVFTWTPLADQISTPSNPYTVTFTVTDDFTTPASTTEAVAISVNPTGAGYAAIKRLSVQRAVWKQSSGKLVVQGRLVLSKGKVSTGLTVNVLDGDTGTFLGSAVVNRKGNWVFAGILGQNASPCSVNIEIRGRTASKKVSRSSCGR